MLTALWFLFAGFILIFRALLVLFCNSVCGDLTMNACSTSRIAPIGTLINNPSKGSRICLHHLRLITPNKRQGELFKFLMNLQ